MSARASWSDAAGALRRVTAGELRTLWQVARLPLVWAGVLASLGRRRGAESIHRHLARLRDAGLVAWLRSSRWPLAPRTAGQGAPDRPPRLFYPTDLGLAVLSLDSGDTPEALARRHRLRRRDLLAAVAGLPQLAAAYTLLALVAAARPSPCAVVVWERPWRRRFRVPTAAAPLSVSLPAYASLAWADAHRPGSPTRAELLLLPDLGVTPVAAHRTTVGRLLDWHTERTHARRWPAGSQDEGAPAVLIATPGEERAEVWRSVLDEAAATRRESPLPATIVTWRWLRAGAARLALPASPCRAPASEGAMLPRAPLPARPVPRLIGPPLTPPGGGVEVNAGRRRAAPALPERAGAAAVGLTDADRVLLDAVGRHPFLPTARLTALLGWPRATVRRCRERLRSRGLLRLAGREDVPEAIASQEPLELTAAGVLVVAAQLGLTIGEATRHVGLAGGGPEEAVTGADSCTAGARQAPRTPTVVHAPGTAAARQGQPLRRLAPARRARRRLLRHAAHTLGADAVFVELAAAARALAAGGGDAGLEEWRGPAACARGGVRPDGYAILRLHGRRFGFFLEYDRGTERPAQHLAKLDAFYAYRDTGRYSRDYDGFPTILVVARDTDAEQRLAAVAVAAAIGRGRPLPLLLTAEWRFRGDGTRRADPEGLLGPIWREPGGGRRRRWPAP